MSVMRLYEGVYRELERIAANFPGVRLGEVADDDGILQIHGRGLEPM